MPPAPEVPQYYANWHRVGDLVYDKWYDAVDDTPMTEAQLDAAIKESSVNERIPKHRFTAIKEYVQGRIFRTLIAWYPRIVDATRPNYDVVRALIPSEAGYVAVAALLFQHVEEWERDAAARPPLPELAALATDAQSVHTGPVNKQTNDNIELLKKTPVPRGQQTLDEILTEWLKFRPYDKKTIAVLKDMRVWGKKEYVIEKGDYAYRVLLRTLWAKIKEFGGDVRAELTKRLWEECYESLGMCAQGHLSRLSNVLVGFVEGYKPPISSMETFQDTIAEIARGEGNVEEKITAARALMDEIKMPEEDRAVWLEAFD